MKKMMPIKILSAEELVGLLKTFEDWGGWLRYTHKIKRKRLWNETVSTVGLSG